MYQHEDVRRVVIPKAKPPLDAFGFSSKGEIIDGALVVDLWTGCRDQWHTDSKTSNAFFFTHIRGKGRSVAAFINQVEANLGIKNKSCFGPTATPRGSIRPGLSWVQFSKWWHRYAMRRSLFSILIRVGNGYKINKKNYEESLRNTKFILDTKEAFNHFMRGHTRYTGKISGWHQQFYWGQRVAGFEIDSVPNKPKMSKIRKLLVRP